MSSDPIVRVRGLSKCYPAHDRPNQMLLRALLRTSRAQTEGVWAVRNVSFDIADGEAVGLIGRNGCGKSTLLQMICGTLPATEGTIDVRGRIAALLELGAGFNREFTGRENIRLNSSILGLSQREIESRIDAVIDFAEIGSFIDRAVRSYSSGMFARLAFSVAIHVDPDLLIVDEILSVGDEAFQRKCFARIEEIRAKGAAILFVSHAANSVVELCDRAFYMHEGEILFDGSAKAAVTHYHRILYAPPNRAHELRDELRTAIEPITPDLNRVPEVGTPKAPPTQIQNDDLFDPLLVPKSTVVYDVCGAEITRPKLLCLDGRPINCLRGGQRYIFEYDLDFEQTCFDVRVHMLVKGISGLELGGGVTPPISDAGVDFGSGKTQTVRFEFDCPLLSGVYFINCGVTGNGGKQLHRIVDALMFRVLPVARSAVFGIVDFACEADIYSRQPVEDKS